MIFACLQSSSPVNTFVSVCICVCVCVCVCVCLLQKINHFPGMSEICRKDLLARNMNRMVKLFPKDYNIFPRTWCLPAESVCTFKKYIYISMFGLFYLVFLWVCVKILTVLCSYSDFQAYTRAKKSKTYICKPDTGCQGKGIVISRSSKDIQPGEHMICQVYISRVRVYRSSHTHTHTHTHWLKFTRVLHSLLSLL